MNRNQGPKQEAIELALQEVFGAGRYSVHHHPPSNTYFVEKGVDGFEVPKLYHPSANIAGDITFDNLAKLSELLGTRLINVGAENYGCGSDPMPDEIVLVIRFPKYE